MLAIKPAQKEMMMERVYSKTYDDAEAALRAARTLLVNGTSTWIKLVDDRGGNGGIRVDVSGPRPNGAGWQQIVGPMGELLKDGD